MTFGEKLQKLRKARGWTQEELAQQAGVSRQSLSKWESDAALPDTANVVVLSDLFGVSTDYLLREAASGTTEATPVPAAPAAPSKRMPHTHLTVGCIMTVLGLILWMPIFIMSVMEDHDLTVYAGGAPEHYTGMQAFIRVHDIQFVYYAAIALLLVGLTTVFVPFMLEWLMSWIPAAQQDDD